MLESLKASLFLFFLFFPSILLEKALPPSLLVARNSALPYQILSPSNDEEKKRENPTIRSSSPFLIIELGSFVIWF